ncbi:DUF4402 domain-containing protein [uncultured Fusobacterium sp.]|uniref:DUF4402 domain-containing protein n=1 Tax=uncultured Fusobacterium sp. TaxID=159267 RepID=UPI0025E4140C|nr:DUF4402 domain-containing protein [uncultured Fusobacterium sp.]
MKKTLLLLGALGVFASLSAANAIDASGNLQIKAEVVKPLTLTLEALDFGIVAQGGTKTAANPGAIKIEGQEGRNVSISFTSNGVDNNLFANEVALNHETAEGQTIVYTPNVTLDGAKLSNSTITLTEGSAELKVGGTVTAAADAALGNYNTDVVVRVAYN